MSAVFQAGVLATKAVEMLSFSHASKQRVVPGIPICLSLSKARSKVPVLEMQHHSLRPIELAPMHGSALCAFAGARVKKKCTKSSV